MEQVQIIRKHDGEVKYDYFGGKEEFDRAMAQAGGAATATNYLGH